MSHDPREATARKNDVILYPRLRMTSWANNRYAAECALRFPQDWRDTDSGAASPYEILDAGERWQPSIRPRCALGGFADAVLVIVLRIADVVIVCSSGLKKCVPARRMLSA